jgi:N6-adenosine-specific RNA methylase IME4/ParB-like chromosome segregation protein Spo0J
MSAPLSPTVLGIGSIVMPSRRMRRLQPELVNRLVESMGRQGQLQPIIVRPSDLGGHELVAGRHRFEAARELGWETIDCRVVRDLDADMAQLVEIDENLVRGELGPADQAAHLAKRKEIYERLYPQARHGGDRRSSAQHAQLKVSSFAEDTATKTGKHRATIDRAIARATAIPQVEKVAGSSLDQGVELDALAKLPKANRDRLIERAAAGEKVSAKTHLKKVLREAREAALATKQRELPQAKYGTIVADPPRRLEPWSRETGLNRAADNHYPTQSLDEIRGHDVASIAADDCTLFLWATPPMLLQALEVMIAWGFSYVTHFVWVKDKPGTGYWARQQHEVLLVGTRGHPPAPAPGTQWPSVIVAPVGEHSVKPERALELVEAYFPSLPKIELHRRGPPRPGWDAWGNEAKV